MDYKRFQNPETILRPAPFWAINDKITPEETARQFKEMLGAGFSGGFFHSRHGLITDYLSDEWFEAMNAALEVAKERDGYLWLYDEDLWPSGNAGGQVAGMKDDYRAAVLEAEFVPAGCSAFPDEDDSFRNAYVIEGRKCASIIAARRINSDEARPAQPRERILFRRKYLEKIPWWGGESYANLLNPEAVQQFVKLTHEVYKAKLGKDFGGRIPGIFTDEPQISQAPNAMPWWDGLPEAYANWHGRDFWSDLPWMYFDGTESRIARLLIHRTVLRQFCEAYSRPIFEWCAINNLEHTGHYMAEDNFAGQIQCHMGGVMAHYRYQHAPGIDHLCRQTQWHLLTNKQVGSAARQLGRRRVLTEIFGVTRHTNTFEDFKWLGDFDLALGANFFCPHLSWYSMKGRRKRDYPPNWNYQQTYWNELRPLNDYFTRISAALTTGEAAPSVLILHPIESATCAHRYGFYPFRRSAGAEEQTPVMPVDLPHEDLGAAKYFDQMLHRVLTTALNSGFDCDLGDEGYIEDLGSVDGGRFKLGRMSYKAVVVPPSTTWRETTVSLLEEFSDAGGTILFVGETPTEVDCVADPGRWKELIESENSHSVACSQKQISTALYKYVDISYTLTGADGRLVPQTFVHHRVDEGQHIFFIINSDRDRTQDYRLTLKSQSSPNAAVLNPLDGSAFAAEFVSTGKDSRLEFTLPPAGSLLLVVGGQAPPELENAPTRPNASNAHKLEGPWKYRRSEPNVLVLDRISASVDEGATWWDEDLEHRIRRRLAEHFGTTDALRWQPWVAIRKKVFDGKGTAVLLRYTFGSDLEKPKNTFLVLEEMHKAKVTVNGEPAEPLEGHWHFDRGFGKAEIGRFIRMGDNVVEVRLEYDFLTEIESAYIVGDFGVALENTERGKLTDLPNQLVEGSWIEQGYPFYSGIITYEISAEIADINNPAFLKLVNPSGTLFKVRVNGKPAGSLLWRPFELDISGLIVQGTNSFEIDVISSRQNTFGPLHERQGDDLMWCGPNAFEDDNEIRDAFSLFDYGLLGGIELVRG